jgi:hypothetical protein
MAIRKNGKWKDRQHKPPERRVNGRTDNTMAIKKKSKWHLLFFVMAIVLSVLPFTLLSDGHCVVCPSIYPSFKDRQHKPSERRVNGRTDNTMAIRKKGKSKDRQHKPPERTSF